MAQQFINRVQTGIMSYTSGVLTLGAAHPGFQTLAQAGGSDGETTAYYILDGADFEIGTGVIGGGGATITTTVVETLESGVKSTSRLSSLSANAQVTFGDIAQLGTLFSQQDGPLGQIDLTTAPTVGDLLQFDGNNFVPVAGSNGGASALDDLSDVDTATTAPAVGDLLQFDGNNFVPQDVPSGHFDDASSIDESLLSLIGSIITLEKREPGGGLYGGGAFLVGPTITGADGGRKFNVLDSDGVSFGLTRLGTSPVPILDWWGGGAGAADSLTAYNQAVTTDPLIAFGKGKYVFSGPIQANNQGGIMGVAAPHMANPDTLVDNGTFIEVNGSGTGGLTLNDATTPLNHFSLTNIALKVNGSYDDCISGRTVRGLQMNNVFVTTDSLTTGGIKLSKGASGDSSWVGDCRNVAVRLPDASTKNPLYTDRSDFAWFGGALTGGVGSVMLGTGGFKFIGTRFDRSTSHALQVFLATDGGGQGIIIGCQIEEFDGIGLVVNGDGIEPPVNHVGFNFSLNTIRPRGGSIADIRLVNNSGAALSGGQFMGNVHTGQDPNVPKFQKIAAAGWTDIVFGAGPLAAGGGLEYNSVGELKAV